MELMMYVGNDFIASQPVNSQKLMEPGYLNKLEFILKKKNSEVLKYTSEEPEFWVVNFSENIYERAKSYGSNTQPRSKARLSEMISATMKYSSRFISVFGF